MCTCIDILYIFVSCIQLYILWRWYLPLFINLYKKVFIYICPFKKKGLCIMYVSFVYMCVWTEFVDLFDLRKSWSIVLKCAFCLWQTPSLIVLWWPCVADRTLKSFSMDLVLKNCECVICPEVTLCTSWDTKIPKFTDVHVCTIQWNSVIARADGPGTFSRYCRVLIIPKWGIYQGKQREIILAPAPSMCS